MPDIKDYETEVWEVFWRFLEKIEGAGFAGTNRVQLLPIAAQLTVAAWTGFSKNE